MAEAILFVVGVNRFTKASKREIALAMGMKKYLGFAATSLLAIASTTVPAETAPANGSGAYATGKYRNLFAEDGHLKHSIRHKIDAAYKQLFHGDPHTQAIAFAAGSNAN